MFKKFQYIDYWLLIPYLVLVTIGVIMVYSASSSTLIANGLPPTIYFKKQLIFSLVGLFVLVIIYLLRVHFFYSRKTVIIGLAVTFFLLIFLFIMKLVNPAAAVNGAVGWINLGPINIQPIEIAKVSLILYLAYIFGKREDKLYRNNYWHNIWPPVAIAAVFMGLAVLQPDVGGAAILGFILIIMLALSGIPWKFASTAIAFFAALAVGVVHWLANVSLSSPILKIARIDAYQLARVKALFHPFQLEQSGGIQLVNSYYAINNGGWFGVGLGKSVQKMGYLPEPYTDFILSVIAEELGVIGVAVIILLLGTLIVRSFYVGLRVKQTYLSLICYGIGTMFFVQTAFNVGGLIGVLPITGVTLPFISYGGSSMLILAACIGIVLNISAYEKKARIQKLKEVA